MRARRVGGVLAAAAVVGALLLVSTTRGNPKPVKSTAEPPAEAQVDEAVKAGPAAVDFVPPTDSAVVITQPDGSTFRAQLTPAELGGRLEVDGFTVVQGDDGWWYYAAAGPGPDGDVVPTDAVVGRDPAPAAVPTGVGRVDVAQAAMAADPRVMFAEVLENALGQATAQEAKRQKAAGEELAVAAGPVTFKFPVLMLATWWDEAAGQTEPQFQPGSDTADYFKAILDGFGGNPKGTLTEYYFENSYGQFLVEVSVYGPYQSQISKAANDPCYYGGIDPPDDPVDDIDPFDNVLGVGGVGVAGMIAEVVPQADAEVPFDDFDNNGDGYVDFTGVIHSGADMAVTGDPCNTWSHALPISAFGDIAEGVLGLPTTTFQGGFPTTEGVLVDRAFTMPEFDEVGGGLNIGVASHEMAHALGEPDYYAVNGSSSGDGDWDVMSGGSYMGNPSGSNPAWFNPASRVFQGWVTPTIIHDDDADYILQPRTTPIPGYTHDEPHPNLVLVPTRWIKVGDVDDEGYEWTDTDVYGLVLDGDNGYVIEGWYLEYVSRLDGPHDPLHPEMTRSPYFDRAVHGSGLQVWHFDYWRRSNVYFGSNNAQDDANRMQMDVEEWDFNDNTQEIGLNFHRGESSDPVRVTATGITSGTHRNNPNVPDVPGTPQPTENISGELTLLVLSQDAPFTVDPNPANYTMRVAIKGVGDCILQLFRVVDGEEIPASGTVDSGSAGAEEEIIITLPEPGEWIARVSDFAACGPWSGTVEFEAPTGFDAKGTADTWSNLTELPTGWAFTNIRADGESQGLDLGSESGFANTIKLDILNLDDDTDFSPGYVTAAKLDNGVDDLEASAAETPAVLSAGAPNLLSVPIFSNGSEGAASEDVLEVTVREGGPNGDVIAGDTLTVPGFANTVFEFSYAPAAEGPVSFYVEVDPKDDFLEGSEANNAQLSTLWAGPAAPVVLVVDDEGYTDGEQAHTGALAALGVPYAITTAHATAEEMSNYAAVIWVGSIDRGPGQLDETDREEIAEYLDAGGQLWLASNRAAGAAEIEDDAEFLNGYFGATTIETTTLEKPHFVEGTGAVFADDLGFELQPYPIRPFSDLVDPAAAEDVFGTATQLLTLTQANKPGRDGSSFGIGVVGDADHNAFQTVLTPFSLSQASTADTWVALTRSVLAAFSVPLNTYEVDSDDPLVFHADVRFQVSGRDTPVTGIVLGGDLGQPVTLFYRVHGTDAFTALPMATGGEPGVVTAVIPGAVVTPSGLDYYVKAGSNSTFDPAPAADGDLTHAIAVAIPEGVAPETPIVPDTPRAPTTPAAGPVIAATGGTEQLLLVAGLLVVALLVRRSRAAFRG